MELLMERNPKGIGENVDTSNIIKMDDKCNTSSLKKENSPPLVSKPNNKQRTEKKKTTKVTNVHVGMEVWIPHPKDLWILGTVESISSHEETATVYALELSMTPFEIPIQQILPCDPSHLLDLDDIAQVNNIHEAVLLNLLRSRFRLDKIYTYTADVLISVNPYKEISLLYDIARFQQLQENNPDHLKQPHLFSIAEKAYTEMLQYKENRAVIISGESGAGKTEASKYLMRYLVDKSKKKSIETKDLKEDDIHKKVEESVIESNLILESFGNAKTQSNDNSSRFGKFIKIVYDDGGRIIGVVIQHYLLERTRIVPTSDDEGNYHIFYQMLEGLDEDSLQRLHLKDIGHFELLKYGDTHNEKQYAQEFSELKKSFICLGIGEMEQWNIFNILAAVLLLGNLEFHQEEGDEDQCSISSPDGKLQEIASLLGTTDVGLCQAMTSTTTISGRGSVLKRKLNCKQSQDARDALCKSLYGTLFNHLVEKINQKNSYQFHQAAGFIGILDIFGFEVFQVNGFEQLCINFANEMLQQQFNKHIFVLEQERYIAENITWSMLEFKNNQEILELIEKPPQGLLAIVDEQVILKRTITDKQLLTIFHQTHLGKNNAYSKPRFESDEFIIKHYAGDVVYDINGFMEKNTDNLHDALLDMLRNSTNNFIGSLFAKVEETTFRHRRCISSNSVESMMKKEEPTRTRKKSNYHQPISGSITMASSFCTELSGLMTLLWDCYPYYVKCIKPNTIKFPGGFTPLLVRNQLMCSGVLEVVRIRQQGYPTRKKFVDFHQTFDVLIGSRYRYRQGITLETTKIACQKIGLLLEPNSVQMGKTEIYLRHGQLEILHSMLHHHLCTNAAIIQSKMFRYVKAYCQYQKTRQGFIHLQAIYKCRLQQSRYICLRQKVIQIQAMLRMMFSRNKYHQQKKAAILLHAVCRGFLCRRSFSKAFLEHRAAISIQLVVRTFLTRKWFLNFRSMRLKQIQHLQSLFRMFQARKQYIQHRNAIILLQAISKGYCARQQYIKGKIGTVASQALVRKALQRKKFLRIKRFSIRLQSFFRMLVPYLQFRQQKKAVLCIQKWQRQQKEIQSKKRQIFMAIRIQTMIRNMLPRKRLERRRKRIILAQATIQMYLQRKQYQQIKSSICLIQNVYRSVLRHRLFQSRLKKISEYALQGYGHEVLCFLSSYPEFRSIRYNGMRTLFQLMVFSGKVDSAKLLIEQTNEKEDALQTLSQVDGKGNNLLHICCEKGSLEMLKYICTAYNDSLQEISSFENNTKENGKIIYQGYLWKRRKTSRWMKRYVVLCGNPPTLHYYKRQSKVLKQAQSDKAIQLKIAHFKKCGDMKNTFEIHSPELLKGRNNEGRLYFQAKDEKELQCWLGHLRNLISLSLQERTFHMHRQETLHYIHLEERRKWMNSVNQNGDTPLHVAIRSAYQGKQEEVDHMKMACWLIANGCEVNILNLKKETPYMMTSCNRHLDVLSMRLAYCGADLKGALTPIPLTNIHQLDPSSKRFLAQPGLVRNSSYVSIYIENLGLVECKSLHSPAIRVTVYDYHRQLVEDPQITCATPLNKARVMWWGIMWHMQTPLENLNDGAIVVFELLDESKSKNDHIEVICWTYIALDKRFINSSRLNAEMFLPPIDLTLKKMIKKEAFISGDIFINAI